MAQLKVPVTSADHVQGSDHPTVTLVEYGDYECPHCAAAQSAIKQIVARYGSDLRFAYRHFPLVEIHPHARPAAEAAEFAGSQGLFWPMHEAIFANQHRLNVSLLIAVASRLKLSAIALRDALAAERFTAKVQADFMGGVRSGVNGTPAFFADGVRHDSPYGVTSLPAVIDQAIAAAAVGQARNVGVSPKLTVVRAMPPRLGHHRVAQPKNPLTIRRCNMPSATHPQPATARLDHAGIARNAAVLPECYDVSSRPVSRREASVAVLSAAALAFAGSSKVVRAQAVQLVVVDVKAIGQGYRISKLIGKNVQNEKDEKIGTLDEVVVTSDRKLFSIVQVGGFLHLGGRLIAVPYESLQIADDGRRITLAGASKAALEKLPEFQYRT